MLPDIPEARNGWRAAQATRGIAIARGTDTHYNTYTISDVATRDERASSGPGPDVRGFERNLARRRLPAQTTSNDRRQANTVQTNIPHQRPSSNEGNRITKEGRGKTEEIRGGGGGSERRLAAAGLALILEREPRRGFGQLDARGL